MSVSLEGGIQTRWGKIQCIQTESLFTGIYLLQVKLRSGILNNLFMNVTFFSDTPCIEQIDVIIMIIEPTYFKFK